MKLLTDELIHKIRMSHAGVSAKNLQWSEIFDSGQELIDVMMTVKADDKTTQYNKLPKGYAYIDSFQKYYVKHGMLSDKQMTQLKRLAVEIAYTKFVQGY